MNLLTAMDLSKSESNSSTLTTNTSSCGGEDSSDKTLNTPPMQPTPSPDASAEYAEYIPEPLDLDSQSSSQYVPSGMMPGPSQPAPQYNLMSEGEQAYTPLSSAPCDSSPSPPDPSKPHLYTHDEFGCRRRQVHHSICDIYSFSSIYFYIE